MSCLLTLSPASSEQEYEELAVALGTDHARRLALRERLKAVRLTCPLFDTKRWVAGAGSLFMSSFHSQTARV